MNRLDSFIANIYRAGQFHGTADFRETLLALLGGAVPFDGALWGNGNRDENCFHSVITLGVHEDYPRVLEKTVDLNPMRHELNSKVRVAVNMSDIISDKALYASDIYRRCFSRFGVERVMSFVEVDRRTQINTLISLYRFERERPFTEQERLDFERAAFHMVNAAQNALFLHMAKGSAAHPDAAAAICDRHGLFYEAQPDFMDLLERHFPDWPGDILPFDVPAPDEVRRLNGLCVAAELHDDLHYLRLWEARPTDTLPEIDRRIVDQVCQGMTFKEIGRELELAPSTVSNRLYRIYRKLGIRSRVALAKLVRRGDAATSD